MKKKKEGLDRQTDQQTQQFYNIKKKVKEGLDEGKQTLLTICPILVADGILAECRTSVPGETGPWPSFTGEGISSFGGAGAGDGVF